MKAKLRNTSLDLDGVNAQLFYSRICHQWEAQSRQTLQKGLDFLQHQLVQLTRKYRSIYEEYGDEKTQLQKDLRIANELIDSQKQLIEMYQSQQQQQPPGHLAQGGPLLSQCSHYNDSSQYPPYQPPRSHEFVIDPAGLRPLNDFDYSIGPPESSCDTNPVMSTPVTQFEEQTPNLSVPPVLHPTSAERDAPVPTHKSDGRKRGPGDGGAKSNKKQKMNAQ